MFALKHFTLEEISLLEAELVIARLRKWMVCLGAVAGALFVRFDSLTAAQGFVAAAAVYYSFQVEGYYRSAGLKGLKHLSTLLDFTLLWCVLGLWTGFEYQYLGLFFINAIFLAMRFAISGWPWLLVNIVLFGLALGNGGNLSTAPLEALWLLMVSALGVWLARERRQMDGRFMALYRCGQLINSSLRESQILQIAVRELAAGWPGYNCHVAKLNSRGEFSVAASSSDKMTGKLELGSVITAILVENMETVVIDNTLRDKRLTSNFLSKFYLKSLILAPVVEQGRTTGLLLMESKKIKNFNNGELALVMLASSQIGTSIENARLYEQMERLARFDELTNIYNRRAFHQVAEDELAHSRQNSARMSMVLVDIDFFKQINDRWGHQTGDQVLTQVAQLIKQNLREEDSVARFGGEEFVIILPGADGGTALQVAERVRRVVEGENWLDGMKVTVSAGVASHPEDGEILDELLRSADRALYKAKSGGRNRVCHVCVNP